LLLLMQPLSIEAAMNKLVRTFIIASWGITIIYRRRHCRINSGMFGSGRFRVLMSS
jgi:hypothetical protein